MNKKIFFILVLFSSFCFSQENNILGKWILEKITYSNGSDLEINHPLYSTQMINYISPNSIIINGAKVDARFENNKIIINNRVQEISFSNKFLTFNSLEDNLKYYFTKEKDFIEKYSEYLPNKTEKNNTEVLISNTIIEPVFFDSYDFKQSFLISLIEKYEDSQNKNFDFFIKLIIDENNKIISDEIFGENLIDKDIANIKSVLKTKENKFINTFGKKILVNYNFKFGINSTYQKSKENKFDKIFPQIKKYYNANQFNKVIDLYEKLDRKTYNESYNKQLLAISYLATNKIDKACNTFLEIGKVTDFSVRNYVKNFCQKN